MLATLSKIPWNSPRLEVLPLGREIHRIHLSEYSGDVFNPCLGGPTRFAPIADVDSRCVPSLYAGQSFDCAAYETIFHGVPVKPGWKTVRIQEIRSRSHSVLQVRRELKLVALRTPDLKRWGVEADGSIRASPKRYSDSNELATEIHRSCREADGLVWTSNQCDPDSAYLFFGDRVMAADLDVVTSRPGARNQEFLADVRQAGKYAGIVISV